MYKLCAIATNARRVQDVTYWVSLKRQRSQIFFSKLSKAQFFKQDHKSTKFLLWMQFCYCCCFILFLFVVVVVVVVVVDFVLLLLFFE